MIRILCNLYPDTIYFSLFKESPVDQTQINWGFFIYCNCREENQTSQNYGKGETSMIGLNAKISRNDMIRCVLCGSAPCDAACEKVKPAALLRSVWLLQEK